MKTGAQKVEELLEVLAARLHLPVPFRKEDTAYHVAITGQHTITAFPLATSFLLWARISACPVQRREECLTLVMRANFLGQGTGGAVIGLDAEEKYLTLSLTIPYEVEFKTFNELLDDFVNYVDYWREQVRIHDHPAQGPLG